MKKIFFLTLIAVSSFACEEDDDPKNCVENPKKDCMCTMEYDPVCGCNNKTYGNACAAECAGITEYEKGECPKADK